MAHDGQEHGGRLHAAARHWGIPATRWLDLSTGINPRAWPLPAIPDQVWQRLPDEDDGLSAAVRQALQLQPATGVLPLPGSQAAIQLLPTLRRASRVAVPTPGYAEHAAAWRAAGHAVQPVPVAAMARAVDTVDVLVWIQPNNPTGDLLPPAELLDWHARLVTRGGWLIVDEAFIETCPDYSLQSALGRPGLLVLRSFGKFFGLAGLRAGLLLGDAEVCEGLAAQLGPWAVSGPARYLMQRALADHAWQRSSRRHMAAAGRRLTAVIEDTLGVTTTGTDLFRYWEEPRAEEIQERLAREAILIRRFVDPTALRIGLPGAEQDWGRLQAALQAIPR